MKVEITNLKTVFFAIGNYFRVSQLYKDGLWCEPRFYSFLKKEVGAKQFDEAKKEFEFMTRIFDVLSKRQAESGSKDFDHDEWLERIREEVGE